MDRGLVGTIIAGKYRVDSFLNRGGMGEVYRATHLMLEQEVVIKVIHPELVTSKDIVARFQREARAASQLSHPNIVNVFDLGETEDGSLYIAMELIDGVSLAELMEKEERGEVVFWGCVIEQDQPTWQCSKCRAEFYKAT